jgi:hypothetical protein
MLVVRQILTLAPFYKRHSFQSEREWRLVKVAPLAELANMKFMSQPRFGLKSYVELSLDGEPDIIPEIVVGPGHETLGFAKVYNASELFEKNGFKTAVRESSSSLWKPSSLWKLWIVSRLFRGSPWQF